MKNLIQVLLLVVFVAIALTGCKKNSEVTLKNKIVYIYDSDNTDGVAFKNLFETNGCSVMLVDRSNANSFDYSSYNLIVIGANTSQHSSNSWTTTNTTAIKNSGKPLLLLGEGGFLFGDAIGTTVSWGNSATNSQASFTVIDPSSALWHQPKQINVSGNSFTLYTAPTNDVALYVASTPVANVVLIGQEPNYNQYYPIVFEQNKYGAFGFYGNVNTMTSSGKDFFVNFVYFVGGLTL